MQIAHPCLLGEEVARVRDALFFFLSKARVSFAFSSSNHHDDVIESMLRALPRLPAAGAVLRAPRFELRLGERRRRRPDLARSARHDAQLRTTRRARVRH